ncbi:hypothetical protein E4634_03600 [Mangrovimicrobium sediminis]|uniref:Uncharacterized protein n=1 Tax=Mangrovimicrobium sediminis TaxID=2562682 RepID=A0A4Z0M709_9GAMM|nr:hypothetical protein [Haliea sp. SAOS-164]TGD75105.1 hypothetical protein E4634_03600 [Haliea sp. SAOS-164]
MSIPATQLRTLVLAAIVFSSCGNGSESKNAALQQLEQDPELYRQAKEECREVAAADMSGYIDMGLESAVVCDYVNLVSWDVVESYLEQRIASRVANEETAVWQFNVTTYMYVQHSASSPLAARLAAAHLQDPRILAIDANGRYRMLLAVVYLNSACHEKQQAILRILDESYARGGIPGAALRVYLYANPYACFDQDLVKAQHYREEYETLSDGKYDYNRVIELLIKEDLLSVGTDATGEEDTFPITLRPRP